VKLPELVQRKFSSVFSETAANYEAFCQMRIKIWNLNILNDQEKDKFKNHQRTLKNRFNAEDDKKAKIFRGRVPLNV
jgi:hypothetical protein